MLFKNDLIASRNKLVKKLVNTYNAPEDNLISALPLQAISFIHGLTTPSQTFADQYFLCLNLDDTLIETLPESTLKVLYSINGTYSTDPALLCGMIYTHFLKHVDEKNLIISKTFGGDIHIGVRLGRRNVFSGLASINHANHLSFRDNSGYLSALRSRTKKAHSLDIQNHTCKLLHDMLRLSIKYHNKKNSQPAIQDALLLTGDTETRLPLLYTLNSLCWHLSEVLSPYHKPKLADLQNIVAQHVGSEWNALCSAEQSTQSDTFKSNILALYANSIDKFVTTSPIEGMALILRLFAESQEEVYHLQWNDVTQLCQIRAEIPGEGMTSGFLSFVPCANFLIEDAVQYEQYLLESQGVTRHLAT